MTDFCRLCASLKTLPQLIAASDPNLLLKQKLARCCQLELPLNDEFLPQNVCKECVLQLNNSWVFSEKVRQAQDTLKQAFIIDFGNNLQHHQYSLSEIPKKQTKSVNEHNVIEAENSKFEKDSSFKMRSIIISLHLKGLSNEEISKKLNLHENAVTDWILTYQACIDDEPQEAIGEPVSSSDLGNQNSIENAFKTESSGMTHFEDIGLSTYPDPEESSSSELKKEPNEADDVTNYLVCEPHEDEDEENENNNSEDSSDDQQIPDDTDNDCADGEDDEEGRTLVINDEDKNADGTISEHVLKKFENNTWNDYPWNCCECYLSLKNVNGLRTHFTSSHTDSKIQYCCIDCNEVFNKYTVLIKHVQTVHRPHLKYCCDICSTCFWDLVLLRKHRKLHDIGQLDSHMCTVCGKGFSSTTTLQVHAKSHLPEELKNTYDCDICFKKFGTKPNLTTHKRIHAGVRNYTCEQCGKSFVQKGNLENHMLTHLSNTPYNCDICGKSFKTPLRLVKHKTVHTGFKPHKCEICAREFREKGTLREHLRIHTGAMPFTCEFCGKRFRFKGVLTTHRRQHTGERPYSCIECNHHFTNWPNYNKHMKRRHGINTSVTVRKPQAIPPTGMPAKAKLNHVVATFESKCVTLNDEQTNLQNNEADVDNGTIQEANSLCDNNIEYSSVIDGTSEIIPMTSTLVHDTPLTVLETAPHHAHQPSGIVHQMIDQSSHVNNHFSYIAAGGSSTQPNAHHMLGFYNLQGEIELMPNSVNIQR